MALRPRPGPPGVGSGGLISVTRSGLGPTPGGASTGLVRLESYQVGQTQRQSFANLESFINPCPARLDRMQNLTERAL